MTAVLEGNSGDVDEGGDDNGRDNDWGPGDDAPLNLVHGGPHGVGAAIEGEAHGGARPRHNNKGNRGVPPLRFNEMYLAAAVEEEALEGPHKEKWQEAMKSEMESLIENRVYEMVDRHVEKSVLKSK